MTDNAAPAVNPNMEYRRLGDAGLRVSILGFGSWVTFDNQVDDDLAVKCLAAAGAAGCNFFDNAEAYAGGKSEEIMGRAFKALGWPRWSYVVTTKLFWGIHGEVPNMRNTLNRKYLLQAMEASLERFGLDYVDVVYCHRADPNTPLEETVRAMSDIVDRGQATYWGTSEWSADEIRAAIEIADRGTAINTALDELEKGDVLLIAGKGHEAFQLVGDETLPFSDSSVARNAIQRLTEGGEQT